jgi:hypothetical protein
MQRPRVRFTILGMMVAVMITALVITWFRPITQTEAMRIAEDRFIQVPGARPWAGRHRVHAWSTGSNKGNVWIVDFTDAGDGSPLSQIVVTSGGEIIAIGVTPGTFSK